MNSVPQLQKRNKRNTIIIVLLIFAVMLLLSVFNFINSALLFANNAFILLMIPAAFIVPYVLFAASRGGKKYVPLTMEGDEISASFVLSMPSDGEVSLRQRVDGDVSLGGITVTQQNDYFQSVKVEGMRLNDGEEHTFSVSVKY